MIHFIINIMRQYINLIPFPIRVLFFFVGVFYFVYLIHRIPIMYYRYLNRKEMIWKKFSPEIDTSEYAGWEVTRIFSMYDRYGKARYMYICVKDGKKFITSSEEFLKTRILQTKQTILF